MQYKIIVDKQSRTNPSNQKREYTIDIEELRVKGDVHDSLIITKEEDYVIRRLSLSKYGILNILEEPKKELIKELDVELFEGDNYIYLMDMLGNKLYAEYLIKNDFTDIYVSRNEMKSSINQTAKNIELNVNQKLEGYSTKEEVNSKIDLTAQAINLEVTKKVGKTEFGTYIQQNWESIKFAWNQISQYLQLEGINGKATLNIYNGNHNMLMSLNQDGETFFDENGKTLGTIGIVREKQQDILAFSMPVDWKNVDNSRTMAWGIVAPDKKFLPIFYLGGYYGGVNSEYGGELIVEGKLTTDTLKVVKRNGHFCGRHQF